MLFMTSHNGGNIYNAMLAHQEMFGRFLNPRRYNMDCTLWENWGLDNGAFAGFDQETFLSELKKVLPYKASCRFVVVPDVPFCWQPTLEKFMDWQPSIKRMGFPVALAVQDGATVENIPWGLIDSVFIGGSTEWKRCLWKTEGELPLFSGTPVHVYRENEVMRIVKKARSLGMWVHFGRQANSPQQLWWAYHTGADSVDGTGEAKKPDVYFKEWIAKTMWAIHNHKKGISNVRHSVSNRNRSSKLVSNSIRN